MAESITIIGNVGSEPQHTVTPAGLTITRFRVACTRRAFDESSKTWTDKYTNWYHVSTFRQLAEHAHASIRVGDAVIVTGRIVQRQWEANGRSGTSVDLEAESVGHDLRWGSAQWTRRSRSAVGEQPTGAGSKALPPDDATQPAQVDADGWGVPGPGQERQVAVPF